jgi:multidrug efflux system membrane fusion protein
LPSGTVMQDEPVAQPRRWKWKATALGVAAALGLYLAWLGLAPHRGNQAAAALTPTSVVTVSQPLQREVDVRAGFLGQFSAIDRV